jgi:hypothetical protein
MIRVNGHEYEATIEGVRTEGTALLITIAAGSQDAQFWDAREKEGTVRIEATWHAAEGPPLPPQGSPVFDHAESRSVDGRFSISRRPKKEDDSILIELRSEGTLQPMLE